MPVSISIPEGIGYFFEVTFEWRDKRRRTQRRRTTLSVTGVPLGDGTARMEVQKALRNVGRAIG
jgi:hypothetical protein